MQIFDFQIKEKQIRFQSNSTKSMKVGQYTHLNTFEHQKLNYAYNGRILQSGIFTMGGNEGLKGSRCLVKSHLSYIFLKKKYIRQMERLHIRFTWERLIFFIYFYLYLISIIFEHMCQKPHMFEEFFSPVSELLSFSENFSQDECETPQYIKFFIG